MVDNQKCNYLIQKVVEKTQNLITKVIINLSCKLVLFFEELHFASCK